MRILVMLGLSLLVQPVWAAPKSCAALKNEIEVKIQANGVTSYTLEIVDAKDVSDPNMVVGSCDNGRKRIIYQRNDG